MAENGQTVTIRFYSANAPRLCITYKNKDELYRKFQEQLKKLNIPADAVYWVDNDDDRNWMRSADALYSVVKEVRYSKMYISDSRCPNRARDVEERKGNSKKTN